ncbi:MAG: PHP domain-containing protein [Cytophagaceae bacterium]|nr:PHP domain-containing protein [Cytophagaceae bacterium]
MSTLKGPFFPARQLLETGVPMIDAHGLHTAMTDGQGTLEAYVLQGKKLGLEAVAFTEHASDQTSYDFELYAQSKARLQELAHPMRVYVAAEVKLAHTDGTLDISPERAALVDFIVGVLHSYPDGNHGYLKNKSLDRDIALKLDYTLSKALIQNPRVDVWGHPVGVFSNFYGPYDADKLRELVVLAARQGRIIELNSAYRYRHVFSSIVETCLEINCLISIGSDAHQPSELGHVVGHLRDYLKNRNV